MTRKIYQPSEIEQKWQRKWEETKLYQVTPLPAKNKFYNLMMFPYPSAEGLHIGNMYAFTGSDIYGRYKRMQGKSVFEPIGLDGFGIHSENYAIKIGQHPKELVRITEKNFYRQLHIIGNGYDWSKTLETYDPSYYRWTQWLFLQLFKKGLAYRAKAVVNFCPSCKTVLADEQVLVAQGTAGECERCGSRVEKKEMEQWFFKITKYAQRLLKNLEHLDWSEKVKLAQRNWIGESEGLIFTAPVKDSNTEIQTFSAHFEAFYADTFLVIAPDHPLLEKLLEDVPNKDEIMSFCQRIIKRRVERGYQEEREPEGIFTGKYIVDPVGNGDLPIWVASYALKDYGTGIVKCSAHDERDFVFAKKYGIRLKPVLFPKDTKLRKRVENLEVCYTDMKNGYLSEPSEFVGKRAGDVSKEIIEYVIKKGFGKPTVQYHLRDWLISRQRYWGPPIPMIYCDKDGWVPEKEENLPVLLPDLEEFRPTGITSPLSSLASFVETRCPSCGRKARRETDVSDTFLDSSWYFLRYLSGESSTAVFDPETTQKWLPVDMYIGGAEHSVLHLLYSRFITMVLYDLGMLSFEEPFRTFRAHGLVIKDGAKMSKSKGNVVIPDLYIGKFGADTLRTYLMFLGPFTEGGNFSDSGIEGIFRFMKRVWVLVQRTVEQGLEECEVGGEDGMAMHTAIKRVSVDIEDLAYNTAIAALMEYYNYLATKQKVVFSEIRTLLLLVAPFAPHITEELWSQIGESYSIHTASWPLYDKDVLIRQTVSVVVEVNGKVRDIIVLSQTQAKEQNVVEEKVRESKKVQRYLLGKTPRKIVFVPGKVINIVI